MPLVCQTGDSGIVSAPKILHIKIATHKYEPIQTETCASWRHADISPNIHLTNVYWASTMSWAIGQILGLYWRTNTPTHCLHGWRTYTHLQRHTQIEVHKHTHTYTRTCSQSTSQYVFGWEKWAVTHRQASIAPLISTHPSCNQWDSH